MQFKNKRLCKFVNDVQSYSLQIGNLILIIDFSPCLRISQGTNSLFQFKSSFQTNIFIINNFQFSFSTYLFNLFIDTLMGLFNLLFCTSQNCVEIIHKSILLLHFFDTILHLNLWEALSYSEATPPFIVIHPFPKSIFIVEEKRRYSSYFSHSSNITFVYLTLPKMLILSSDTATRVIKQLLTS